MRKTLIGVLTGALFFAAVGVAIALTNNTVTYNSTLTQKGKAKTAGVNTGYEGILAVGTTDGKQPNVAPLTEVYFAKGLKNNAAKFKSCTQKDIEVPQSNKIPAKCKKAIVGGGTADASVGTPGGSGTPQHLTVVALNGKKGKQIMLALIGGAIKSYVVIPGDIVSAPAPFSYKVNFKVPQALQGTVGVQIALTHFDVKINKTTKYTTGKGKKKKSHTVTYLQVTKCPAAGTLPTKAIVHFANDDGSAGGPVVPNEGTMACK